MCHYRVSLKGFLRHGVFSYLAAVSINTITYLLTYVLAYSLTDLHNSTDIG